MEGRPTGEEGRTTGEYDEELRLKAMRVEDLVQYAARGAGWNPLYVAGWRARYA